MQIPKSVHARRWWLNPPIGAADSHRAASEASLQPSGDCYTKAKSLRFNALLASALNI